VDPVTIALTILFLPLGAFVLQIFFGRFLPRQGDWLPTLIMGGCWGLATWLFVGQVLGHEHGMATATATYPWFKSGRFTFDFGVSVDNMTATMLFVVTTVSFLVHLYSTAYMRDHHGHPEARYNRFFAYLALFTFSMLIIVVTDNLFILFIGWELVGLCSYFLIGFYFFKPSAANASKKAFVVNRVGDFGFFIGIMIVLAQVGKLDLYSAFAWVKAQPEQTPIMVAAAVCLFCGAIGKSAQFPLHVWLPDAMEGPTPVSALIHAATMVAAGVYMVARLFPIFAGPGFWNPVAGVWDSPALWVVAGIGSITAILAATIAIAQTDIKRVLAYSTVSQLGYMVVGLGVGSFTAGMFHLFTHAWFKACLFLGAGAVHHAVETYEMPEMGGLRKKMPITFATYFISTCAIAGVPFLSGFWSKEMIVGNAMAFGIYHQGSILAFVPFTVTIVTAGITAFYMFRTVFLTFTGAPRDHHKYDHAHEMPWNITLPLSILALLAIVGGGVSESRSHWFENRIRADVIVDQYMAAKEGKTFTPTAELEEGPGPTGEHGGPVVAVERETHVPAGGAAASATARFHEAHLRAHTPVLIMSLFVATGGILASWFFFAGPYRDVDVIGTTGALATYRVALKNLYYIDWFYTKVFVGGMKALSGLLGGIDKVIIDGLVNLGGFLGVVLAKLSGLVDYWGVDATVRGAADATLLGGEEARRVQTGRLQEYVYLSVVLIAFIFVVWTVAGTLS
jgi:NADH-quinone oxidoreductase subunit L